MRELIAPALMARSWASFISCFTLSGSDSNDNCSPERDDAENVMASSCPSIFCSICASICYIQRIY
jgi:hypothetical protein